VPDFETRGQRDKWISKQTKAVRAALTLQAKRDAGRARGKQRKEAAKLKAVPQVD
jgi:hypothetical protein